jgi:hypothetical protein
VLVHLDISFIEPHVIYVELWRFQINIFGACGRKERCKISGMKKDQECCLIDLRQRSGSKSSACGKGPSRLLFAFEDMIFCCCSLCSGDGFGDLVGSVGVLGGF